MAIVVVVLAGRPAQQAEGDASQPASTSPDAASATSADDDAQNLGWDKVSLYDGGGVWIMTDVIKEGHNPDGFLKRSVRHYEIDMYGNRLSCKKEL